MKTCIKCEKIKSLEEFYFRKDSNSYRNECIFCFNKKVKERRLNNLEHYREYERSSNRRESRNKRARDSRNENPEDYNKKQREYLKKAKEVNPEKFRNRSKEYIKNASPEIRSRIRERSRILAKERRKTKEGREADRVSEHNRRCRLLGNIKSYEWKDLLSLCENRCLCCGNEGKLTLDHIVPISKGGYNYIQNVQPLCLNCNQWKYTKIIDFRPLNIRQIYCLR